MIINEPAGILQNGTLTVNLEAREGYWFPETHEGEGISVYAFAEKGKSITIARATDSCARGNDHKSDLSKTNWILQ
jgi:hypothetical protein